MQIFCVDFAFENSVNKMEYHLDITYFERANFKAA